MDAIEECFEERELKKNEHLLVAGTLCRELAFIQEGYLRLYAETEERDISFWIGGEGSFITSLSSFVFQEPNRWNIQALTDARLQVIQRHDHFELQQHFPEWLEFDNVLLARAYAGLEGSMFSHLHSTARERFQMLWEQDPRIFNEVPLQHIASMLGMTLETLSRLRKEFATS